MVSSYIPPVASSHQPVFLGGPFCRVNWTNSSDCMVNRPLLGEGSGRNYTHRTKRGAIISRWCNHGGDRNRCTYHRSGDACDTERSLLLTRRFTPAQETQQAAVTTALTLMHCR